MTGRKSADRAALDRVVDLMVEDVLNASDEEILSEMRQGRVDPDGDAVRLRALFERTVLDANKRHLRAAQIGVKASKSTPSQKGRIIDIREARRRLHSVLEQRDATLPLTIAARNESELSDGDVISLIQDLEELGLLSEEKP